MVEDIILSVIAAAVTAAITGFYLMKQFWKAGYVTKRRAAAWWLIGILMLTAASLAFEKYEYSFWKKEKYYFLLCTATGLGVIDQKEHKLPNRFLAVLAGVRVILLAGEIATYPQVWSEFVQHVLFGVCASFLLMMAAYYISGKAIGLGDVKLLTVTGGYLGFSLNYVMLFVALVLAAICGLWKMARRKIAVKDSIAFGPFVAAGIWIVLLLGM